MRLLEQGNAPSAGLVVGAFLFIKDDTVFLLSEVSLLTYRNDYYYTTNSKIYDLRGRSI